MKIIGHRGARGLAPENTLASFSKALEYGANELEFDLRVTRDHVVILHHDPGLDSGSGMQLPIRQHTFAELKQHDPDLLRFEDFLESIDPHVHLLAEIKPQEPTKEIIALLRHALDSGWPVTNISVGSFDQGILRTVHAALPELELVVNEHWSGIHATWRARQLGTRRINMRSWWLWRGFLRGMHRRGYQIAPYTVNDPKRAHKWRPYIYGIITDRPDIFEKRR